MAWSYRNDRADELYADALGPALVDSRRQTDVPVTPFPDIAGGGGASAFSDLTGDFALTQTPSASASTLVGRGSGSGGDWQFITLGTNLSMSGVTLNASGTGGGAVSSVFTRTGDVVAQGSDYIAFYQPLDADLTSIASLTTTPFGRGFLPLADATAARTYIGAGVGTVTTIGSIATNNVVMGGGGNAVQDGGVALSSLALASDVPSNLSDLTVDDASIVRKKINYTSIGALPSSGAAVLVPGQIYYGNVSGDITFSFLPTMLESDPPTRIYANLTTALNVTYPAAIRNADNGSSTTASVLTAQYVVIEFFKTGAGNIRMLDNILPSDSFGTVVATFDGGGNALATQNTITPYTVPYNATIIGWNISVDTGTVTFKTWKKANSTSIPTIADVINTSGVAISTGTHVRSSVVSDFTTTTVTAGDMFVVALTAVSGASKAVFELEMRKA